MAQAKIWSLWNIGTWSIIKCFRCPCLKTNPKFFEVFRLFLDVRGGFVVFLNMSGTSKMIHSTCWHGRTWENMMTQRRRRIPVGHRWPWPSLFGAHPGSLLKRHKTNSCTFWTRNPSNVSACLNHFLDGFQHGDPTCAWRLRWKIRRVWQFVWMVPTGLTVVVEKHNGITTWQVGLVWLFSTTVFLLVYEIRKRWASGLLLQVRCPQRPRIGRPVRDTGDTT